MILRFIELLYRIQTTPNSFYSDRIDTRNLICFFVFLDADELIRWVNTPFINFRKATRFSVATRYFVVVVYRVYFIFTNFRWFFLWCVPGAINTQGTTSSIVSQFGLSFTTRTMIMNSLLAGTNRRMV